MTDTTFMRVEDVAKELGISKSYAYKIVQKLNNELKEQGFIIISSLCARLYKHKHDLICFSVATEWQQKIG